MELAGDLEALRGGVNDAVLAYVGAMSAHDEVAAALQEAAQSLGDAQLHVRAPTGYGAVVLATRGVAFAFAAGMAQIGVRLGPELVGRALATGAAALPAIGPDWVAITLFRDDWPDPDLRFWTRKAYVYARTTGAHG